MNKIKSARECYIESHMQSDFPYGKVEPDKYDILAMEAYAAQFKIREETDWDFINYIKQERNRFAGEIRPTFDLMETKDRVAIEDLLIAYDQMVDRLEKQLNNK